MPVKISQIMDHALPVLIGSQAAKLLSKSSQNEVLADEFCDYDFIVDEGHTLTKDIPTKCVVDITIATKPFHKRILELSILAEYQFKIISTPIGPARVPPLLLLMAIYKSHIHRIQPYHQKQTIDVEKWLRSCFIYNTLRNKVVSNEIVKSFEELDRLLYDETTNHLSPIESAVGELYRLGFEEVNNRLGDTENDLTKKTEDFFNDTVPRKIDHDKLHVLIAKKIYNREPLFTKFQISKESVEMDKNLFLSADKNDKISVIVEEVLVLLVERSLIPWLDVIVKKFEKDRSEKENAIRLLGGTNLGIRNLDEALQILQLSKPQFEGWTDFQLEENWRTVLSHFVTNLCGSGPNAWLRNYCIDHMDIFREKTLYPLKQASMIAAEIMSINFTPQTKPYDITPIKKINATHLLLIENYGYNVPDNYICVKCKTKFNYTGNIWKKSCVTFCDDCDFYSNIHYDLQTGLGTYTDTESDVKKEFNLEFDRKGTVVTVNGSINSDKIDGKYICNVIGVYIKSSGCTFNSAQLGNRHKIQSYGSIPESLNILTETMSRWLLNLEQDEEKDPEINYVSLGYERYIYDDENPESDSDDENHKTDSDDENHKTDFHDSD